MAEKEKRIKIEFYPTASVANKIREFEKEFPTKTAFINAAIEQYRDKDDKIMEVLAEIKNDIREICRENNKVDQRNNSSGIYELEELPYEELP
ncbi:hypothetical protein M2145_002543 [Lachnospiraceae bacterium PF1-21]